MGNVGDDLSKIGEVVRDRFEAEKRVLSFGRYMQLVVDHPRRHSRDAARYLKDCFEHYGTDEIARPWGTARRYRLFDLPFIEEDDAGTEDGARARRSDHLVGQESLQEAFHDVLSSFVREGRPNRLILLHGPNGSAKTTFSQTIMRGLEHYSTTDEGALYRFSWIFPRGRDGKAIGFGSSDDANPRGQSFADLADARVDVKLSSGLREHPIMLLPVTERRALLRRAYETAGLTDTPPDWIWSGQLGHKNQQVFEALLTAYRGDLQRVLNHVQVERYYVSRRYRVGAVTIGPQMAVDASERQITADRTIDSLPAALSSLTLFEPYGELVDASGGVLEYSDLLKRPLDAWKYLLLAIENGEVALQLSNLAVNAVLMASSNEVHLAAFKEHHEYNSFRGRIRPVRVPYLRDYTQEQSIYDAQIAPQVSRHVAPHTTYIAALWAVLTRLRRAQPDRYDSAALGRVAADLTPMEKAELYASGKVPTRLSADDAHELRGHAAELWREWDMTDDYEGLTGASPRELRALLLDAANDESRTFLSPLSLLEGMEAFCQRSDHDFLNETSDRGYQDHRGFVAQVRERWLDRVDGQLRACTGLIDETQYESVFDDYVTHVSYWVKGEKVYDDVTSSYQEPDMELMSTVEGQLGAGDDGEEFRRNLISAIASRAIDHPGEPIHNGSLFPRYIERLRESYYDERGKQVGAIARDALGILDERQGLEPERAKVAQETLDRLLERHDYNEDSAREALGELIELRYASP